jgi:hypothetical protein
MQVATHVGGSQRRTEAMKEDAWRKNTARE